MSPSLKVVATALAACVLPLGAAQGQSEPPQVGRQNIMERNGDSAKVLGAMAKGERPYDAAVAAAELKTISASIAVFVTLFPEGSESGYDTRAKPEIWSGRDAFEARARDLATAADASSAAADGGLEAFRRAFGAVGKACGACHDGFRAPQG